jgi:hypothetical protein
MAGFEVTTHGRIWVTPEARSSPVRLQFEEVVRTAKHLKDGVEERIQMACERLEETASNRCIGCVRHSVCQLITLAVYCLW